VLSGPRAFECCAPGSLAGGAAQGEPREPLVEVFRVRGGGGTGCHGARPANRHCQRLLEQRQGRESEAQLCPSRCCSKAGCFAASVLGAPVTL